MKKRSVIEHFQKLEESAKEEILAKGSVVLKKGMVASKKNVLVEGFMRAQVIEEQNDSIFSDFRYKRMKRGKK